MQAPGVYLSRYGVPVLRCKYIKPLDIVTRHHSFFFVQYSKVDVLYSKAYIIT